jgi:hypothetical protein
VFAGKESTSLCLKLYDFFLVLSGSLYYFRINLSHGSIPFLLRLITEVLEVLIFLSVVAARVSHYYVFYFLKNNYE